MKKPSITKLQNELLKEKTSKHNKGKTKKITVVHREKKQVGTRILHCRKCREDQKQADVREGREEGEEGKEEEKEGKEEEI